MTTDLLAKFDVELVRADNPGPFTLSGTNTYVVERDPCWIVDPGPALDAHMRAVQAAIEQRGGAAGIVLTHDHQDHAEAVPHYDLPVYAARHEGKRVGDGDEVGPFSVVATPGHSPDHLAFITRRICFTGDAVLGEGSVFVSPDPGALRGYLAALERLHAMDLLVLCPGHGPPVGDPAAKIGEYLAHRLDRERRLLEALAKGKRSVDDLLDEAWSDAPPQLRPAAMITLAAHLDKLEEEGRLPEGVEHP